MNNAESIEQEKTEEDFTVEIVDMGQPSTIGSHLFLWVAPAVREWQRVPRRRHWRWMSSVCIVLLLVIVLSMSNGLSFFRVNNLKAADVSTQTVCSALQEQQAQLEQAIDAARVQLSSAHGDLRTAEKTRNELIRLHEPSMLVQAELRACRPPDERVSSHETGHAGLHGYGTSGRSSCLHPDVFCSNSPQ